MKILKLHKKASNKVARGERELPMTDIEDEPSGPIPGEWFILIDLTLKTQYACYLNTQSLSHYKLKIIDQLFDKVDLKIAEDVFAKDQIKKLIEASINKRKIFSDYNLSSRLVYGASDNLIGLIVDKYEKYVLVQINTAGLDRFRDYIQEFFKTIFPDCQVILFDNKEYRKNELLPDYDNDGFTSDLEVYENGLKYKIPKKVIQKIGHYYDHRENRLKLKNMLTRLNLKKESGLDLFSYAGSWGLHLLSAEVQYVDFVDQGDMQEAVDNNLKLNQFDGRGQFHRSDVFKFLDLKISEGKKYDIVVSDPPAFSKSEKNKNAALLGYEKTHQKIFKLLNDQAVFVAASCTHHVSHEDLDQTVQVAALSNNYKIELLDIGIQGFDHPTSGLKDKSFYIKYLAYLVFKK